ncbi:MAG: glycosyltransferase family 9 protein [Ignavibacteria bacterium]|nr:glycosyltransferase family 9 protein [Ignavibacteria bacterium]
MADSIIKRIEIGFRKMFNSYFFRNREAKLVTQPTNIFDLQRDDKVLLLRQDRIGDALITVPILRALKTKYPLVEFHVLLSSNNIGAAHCLAPYMTRVVHFKKGLIGLLRLRAVLRRMHYQVVVDLMDNASSTSAMIIGASGAVHSVGIEKENSGAYSHVVPLADKQRVHIVNRLSALLMPFGIDPSTTQLDLEYRLTEADVAGTKSVLNYTNTQRNIGINLTGADASRTLTEGQVSHAAGAYRARYPDCKIYLFASPEHQNFKNQIANSTSTIAVPSSASFHEFACRISLMDEILTPDTSVVHLAAAWKIPCVVLYVQMNPELMPWYPYNTRHIALVTTKNAVSAVPATDIVRAIETL